MVDRTTRPIVPLTHANEVEHRRMLAIRASASLPKDGSEGMTGPLSVASYDAADLPDATLWEGGLVFIADEGKFAVSDGAVWDRGVSGVIGTDIQAWDADLDAIAALAKTDGNIIVGNGSTWVVESGGTARTSLGLGTGDSPEFSGVNLSHASANTLTGSAGDALIEGNRLFRVGGADVPVADGGTGASDATTARTNLGLGTIATQAANSVSITGGSVTGITDLAIADGGTAASTAATAFSNLKQAASDTATGVVEIAVQSEMETGSDTGRAVTPGRQQYHPSAAKLWGLFDNNGNIGTSYNIASISDAGTGTVGVTIATDFSGSFSLVTGVHDAQANQTQVTASTAGTFTLVAVSIASSPAVNDIDFHMVCAYGDQ